MLPLTPALKLCYTVKYSEIYLAFISLISIVRNPFGKVLTVIDIRLCEKSPTLQL